MQEAAASTEHLWRTLTEFCSLRPYLWALALVNSYWELIQLLGTATAESSARQVKAALMPLMFFSIAPCCISATGVLLCHWPPLCILKMLSASSTLLSCSASLRFCKHQLTRCKRVLPSVSRRLFSSSKGCWSASRLYRSNLAFFTESCNGFMVQSQDSVEHNLRVHCGLALCSLRAAHVKADRIEELRREGEGRRT